MAAKFVDANGNTPKSTVAPAGAPLSPNDDISTNLSKMADRLRKLEENAPPTYMEQEFVLPNATYTFTISHNFDAPVRWFVASWRRSSPVNPIIAEAPTTDVRKSDMNNLVLISTVPGTVVIRVEAAKHAMGGTN